MGNARSSLHATVPANPDRAVFVQYEGFLRMPRNNYVLLTISVSYQRYSWQLNKRFSELRRLDKILSSKYRQQLVAIFQPHRSLSNLFRGQDDNFLINRGREFAAYIQLVCDNRALFSTQEVQEFLEIGPMSLRAELGRKGKEGYVKVCSGGYTVKHSNKPEFLRSWKWRWVALNDTQVSIYEKRDGGTKLLASVPIDQGFQVQTAGRIVILQNNSRKLSLETAAARFAEEWAAKARAFYDVPRAIAQPHGSSFPIRPMEDARVYTTSRDYYLNVTQSMLKATGNIFIAARKLNPDVIMTRPPLPTIRLRQLLKFKADQGVHILISLNREDSAGDHYRSEVAKKKLMALSPRIEVIRHPSHSKSNWLHHENLVVVDRNVAYVAGTELNYGCYDDAAHSVHDEIGCRFPGRDYQQPSGVLHKPVRAPENAVIGNLGGSAIGPFDDEGIDDSSRGMDESAAGFPRNRLMDMERSDTQRNMLSPSVLHGDDDDVSVVEPETALEREARLAAERDEYVFDFPGGLPYPPPSSNTASGVTSNSTSNHESSFPQPALVGSAANVQPMTDPEDRSLLTSFMKRVGGHINQALADLDSLVAGERGSVHGETCLMFPRQPVHSVHVAVSGQPARDIASHFVQRWNHSRLVKWETDRTHMSDVTDQTHFGVCARCKADGLSEVATLCPTCEMTLGPVASFLRKNSDTQPFDGFAPARPSSFTFINFQCQFMGQLGFSLEGASPVVVSRLLGVARGHGLVRAGTIVASQGPNVELLIAHSVLKPAPGDIIVSVDGITVTHLNTEELTRYIRHRKEFLSYQFGGTDLTPMTVLFRRHYIEELHNLPPVVEIEPTLYPVAEFEIMTPAAVVSIMGSKADLAANKSVIPVVSVDAYSAPMPMQEPRMEPSIARYLPSSEPVVPQSDGNDAYAMAMAMMDALQTPLPSTNSSIPPPPFERATSDPIAEVMRYTHSMAAPTIGLDDRSRNITNPEVLPPVPSYDEAVDSATDIRLVSPAESKTTSVDTIVFPEVPVGISAPNPATGSSNYLSAYDMMPLAPSRPPEVKQASAPNRRDIERKPMALSGSSRKRGNQTNQESVEECVVAETKESQSTSSSREIENKISAKSGRGQQYRTRPFDPSAAASTSTASASGFSALSTNTATRTETPTLNPGSEIIYPPSVENYAESTGVIGYPALTELQTDYGNSALHRDSSPGESNNYRYAIASNYTVPPPLPVATPTSAVNVAAPPPQESWHPPTSLPQQFIQRHLDLMNSTPAVPVAVGATEADLHSVAAHNANQGSDGRNQVRVEKGKLRAVSTETEYSMSRLFFEKQFLGSLISSESKSSSYQIQVLRSSSLWSIGTRTECSIQQCWVDTIRMAEKFIYIESEFLISGECGGRGIENSVVSAILERLVQKALTRQQFRVIVILPLWGTGTFTGSDAARVAMMRQYMTICRGSNSLLYQFVKRVPNVDPSNYISFFSLRNWGVMNNRVVSDQIYLNSRLLIVDDRVAVIGTANVNDRSLLGDRDSEIAVRIEDSTHVDVLFGGSQWSVGFLPHMLRVDLMRHHLGLGEADISDPVCDHTYMSLMRGFAAQNSGIYDELDDDASVYRCKSIQAFSRHVAAKVNKSYQDPRIREIVGNIRGYLVFFPLDFLEDTLTPDNNPVTHSGVSLHNLWV